MPAERILPQLLDQHVHVDQWERPAALVRLIAVWSPWPPAPIEISRADLRAALDRDEEQAKYDHRVMVRLAERDRVLIRKRGHPDAWRIDTKSAVSGHWRNVPWRTSRSAFGRDLAHFLRLDAGKPRPIGGERAGQSGQTGAITPPTDTQPPNNASAIDHPLLAGPYPQVASPPGKRSGQSPPIGPGGSVPSQLSGDLKISSHLDERRGGEERALSEEGHRLISALAAKLGVPIRGVFARQLDDLVAAHPARLEELVGRARVMPLFMIREAIDDLAQLVRTPAGGSRVCRRCAGAGSYEEDGYEVICNHMEIP